MRKNIKLKTLDIRLKCPSEIKIVEQNVKWSLHFYITNKSVNRVHNLRKKNRDAPLFLLAYQHKIFYFL